MKIKEKNAILKNLENMSNDELEKMYYKSLYDCLGSDLDVMIELGYDRRDIEERRKYERFLCEKCSLIASVCEDRGIKLFE